MFDAVADVEDAVAKLLASDPTGDDVERISKLADQFEYARLREIAEYDRSGGWASENYLTTASALRDKTDCTPGHSYRSVRLARQLAELPETAAAFAAGEITREHVAIITRRCTDKRLPLFQAIEKGLLRIARDHTYADLESAVVRYVEQFDGLGKDDDHDQELNKVTLSSSFEGRGYLNGSLDPETTDLVLTAFDAEMEALRQRGETRTTPQLRADALDSICRQYLAARGDNHAHGRGQSHVSVVVDIAKYEDAHPELVAAVRAEFAHGQGLSRTTLERISCDCKINRVIMDGPGCVLDVGRTQRTVTNAQWNALVARDKHCTEPGCTMRPAFCEAHHIWHWEHGGPTNLDNLKLLCWYHHRRHHTHHAQARAG
jgi:hypothetical protein